MHPINFNRQSIQLGLIKSDDRVEIHYVVTYLHAHLSNHSIFDLYGHACTRPPILRSVLLFVLTHIHSFAYAHIHPTARLDIYPSTHPPTDPSSRLQILCTSSTRHSVRAFSRPSTYPPGDISNRLHMSIHPHI